MITDHRRVTSVCSVMNAKQNECTGEARLFPAKTRTRLSPQLGKCMRRVLSSALLRTKVAARAASRFPARLLEKGAPVHLCFYLSLPSIARVTTVCTGKYTKLLLSYAVLQRYFLLRRPSLESSLTIHIFLVLFSFASKPNFWSYKSNLQQLPCVYALTKQRIRFPSIGTRSQLSLSREFNLFSNWCVENYKIIKISTSFSCSIYSNANPIPIQFEVAQLYKFKYANNTKF